MGRGQMPPEMSANPGMTSNSVSFNGAGGRCPRKLYGQKPHRVYNREASMGPGADAPGNP